METIKLKFKLERVPVFAWDSFLALVIYGLFRNFYSHDISFNTGDVAVVFGIFVFIFMAGIIEDKF